MVLLRVAILPVVVLLVVFFPFMQVLAVAAFSIHPILSRTTPPPSKPWLLLSSPLSPSFIGTTRVRWKPTPSTALMMLMTLDLTMSKRGGGKCQVRFVTIGTAPVAAPSQSIRRTLGRRYASLPLQTTVSSSNGGSARAEDAIPLPVIAETCTERPLQTKGMDRVAVVQTGLGCCHGHNVTKAAIRAIRNAIDYNSVKIRTIIPGGYDNLKIHLQLGVPSSSISILDGDDDDCRRKENGMELNIAAILQEFPYGTISMPLDIRSGGLLASNGIQLGGTGAAKDDMTLVVACVSIGYDDLPAADTA